MQREHQDSYSQLRLELPRARDGPLVLDVLYDRREHVVMLQVAAQTLSLESTPEDELVLGKLGQYLLACLPAQAFSLGLIITIPFE